MTTTDRTVAVVLVATAILTIAILLLCTGFRCSDADDRKLTPCIPQGVTGTLDP